MQTLVLQAAPMLSANKRNVHLAFVLKHPLPPAIYLALTTNAKQLKVPQVSVSFVVKPGEWTAAHLRAYWEAWFVAHKAREALLALNAKRQDFCLLDQNGATFCFRSAIEAASFSKMQTAFTNWLKAAGFNEDIHTTVIEAKLKREEVATKPTPAPKKRQTLPPQGNETNAAKAIPLRAIPAKGKAIIVGQIYAANTRSVGNATVYEFGLTDYDDAVFVSAFAKDKTPLTHTYLNEFKRGQWVRAECDFAPNKFRRDEVCGKIRKILPVEPPVQFVREDLAPQKKVEFVAHTKMSAADGICTPNEFLRLAKKLEYSAQAITDNATVQAFPDAYAAANKSNVRVLYGCEFELSTGDAVPIANATDVVATETPYIVFDLETTGLSPGYDEVIEFGAIKVEHGRIVDSCSFLIQPSRPISEKIASLTKITNSDLKTTGLKPKEAFAKIRAFIGDFPLVAHNAIAFDCAFLTKQFAQYNLPPITAPIVDTLRLSWALNADYTHHALGAIARKQGVEYKESEAHRSEYDATVLSQVYANLLNQVQKKWKAKTFLDINDAVLKFARKELNSHLRGDKAIVYARNQKGLKALYECVSKALTTNFVRSPQLLWSDLAAARSDLCVAPAPNEGELFNLALAGASEATLIKAAKQYDFVLVSPPDWNTFRIQRGDFSQAQIEDVIKQIIKVTKAANKLAVATSDAYYVHPWQAEYHRVMIFSKANRGRAHRFYDRLLRPALQYGPTAHIRTTSEMINAFAFLEDAQLINEVAYANSINVLNEFFTDDIAPLKTGLHPPKLENADANLATLTWNNAKARYGDPLPPIIEERIRTELDAILTNGYGIVYWIAHLLVKQSHAKGYLVGSRGSVGSSLVATVTGISEINPLPPHYWCAKCTRTEFVNNVDNGFDLVNRECVCGANQTGDGHNIPFATFMGFKGNKVPDIDLNFSGEYQPHAHNHIRDLFGTKHTLRAGTISTYAEKTAFGVVRTYFETLGQGDSLSAPRGAKIDAYVSQIVGAKRTTGQHPGGILVFPKDSDVCDFTPYNYPADETDSEWMTTHFAFESLHDSLLKLDILGHDDPTILHILHQSTGIDPVSIPHHDEKVLSLFSSLRSLKIKPEDVLGETTGVIGIPEFGTKFVRDMLVDTRPQSFADLIRISGLSHGTNVWANNAQKLVRDGLTLREVISCRDDIMIYLQAKNLPDRHAFEIMETVRKGKPLTVEMAEMMREHGVPDWYLQSCRQIKYMFPKAHAAAYVLMAWRIAWFKVYYPAHYYAALYSVKLTDHNVSACLAGADAVREAYLAIQARLENRATKNDVKSKEINLMATYEAYAEMLARGIEMGRLSLTDSEATNFVVKNGIIIPPFVTIDGLGQMVAQSIIDARNEKPFSSLRDLAARTKLSKVQLAKLENERVFKHLPGDDQIKLF